MEHRTDFRNAPTMFLHSHKLWDRAREMSRERSRGQPGTIEIGARFCCCNTIGKPGRLFVGLGSASGKTSPALLVQSDNFSVTNSVTGSNPPERVESGATSTATSTRGVN